MDVVEGPVEIITRKEIVEAIQKMKSGKATGPVEITVEMKIASGATGVQLMFQRILDGRGMPYEWKTSVIVPIFKGKGDVMSCGLYRGVKLLQPAKKIDDRVPERRVRLLLDLNKMQFAFMPGQWMQYSI